MPLPRKGDSRLTIQPSLVWGNSDAQYIPQHHRYSTPTTPTAAPPPRGLLMVVAMGNNHPPTTPWWITKQGVVGGVWCPNSGWGWEQGWSEGAQIVCAQRWPLCAAGSAIPRAQY